MAVTHNDAVGNVDDAYERLLFGIAKRVTGRGLTAIVIALYGGLGLALPLTLGWSVPWLVAANVFGTSLAGTLILVWIVLLVQGRDRRHLIEWTTDLRRLNSAEFEWFVGELFRRDGWKVEETGRQDGPDGGVDLSLTKNGRRTIVQCKRWESWPVGVEHVRAFAGALMREGLGGDAGVFVTLSNFTEQASSEAERIGLTLLDGRGLHELVDKHRRPEPCPTCQSPMVLDRSDRGWWFRCVTRGCTGKRDLGREPALAVELLTQPPD